MSIENLHKVIDKIRKLLAMATSPNPEEAASFLNKAKVLMQQYNISEMDVKESVSDIIEIDFTLLASSEDYMIKFSYWLSKAFSVKAIMVKRNVGVDKIEFQNNIRFIGTQSNVAVSTFVFAYISDMLETKATAYLKSKKTKSKKVKKEFCIGFIEAISIKLKAIEEAELAQMTPTEVEQSTALVVLHNALIERYMNDQYGDKLHDGNDKTEKVDANNFNKGFEKGEKVGIFRGVSDKTGNLKSIEVFRKK
jgi:hypothetical protein